MNGTSVLIRRGQRDSSLILLLCEGTVRSQPSAMEVSVFTSWSHWHHNPRLTNSRTVRNLCCLSYQSMINCSGSMNWLRLLYHKYDELPCSLYCKESACNAGDLGSIPEWGRSSGEGNAAHSSILAWRIPWTEEPGGLQSMGSQLGTHIYHKCIASYNIHEITCVSSHTTGEKLFMMVIIFMTSILARFC